MMNIKKIASYEYATQSWSNFLKNRALSLVGDTVWALCLIALCAVLILLRPM